MKKYHVKKNKSGWEIAAEVSNPSFFKAEFKIYCPNKSVLHLKVKKTFSCSQK